MVLAIFATLNNVHQALSLGASFLDLEEQGAVHRGFDAVDYVLKNEVGNTRKARHI